MLKFRLGDFPIEVHPSFWLVAALLGLRSNDLTYILVWVSVVFVSVLVHELGHAAVGRQYGLRPSIMLYAMGGLTSWQSGRGLSRIQSIYVSFAGPAAGLALGLAFWGISRFDLPTLSQPGRWALALLIWVNIVWSMLNLLPILPLDGGNIMRTVVHIVRGPDERLPLRISIAFAALGAFLAMVYGQLFMALLAAFFAYNNYQRLTGAGAGPMFPGAPRY